MFRSNVSSIVPELMSAALVHETGFGVSFSPTTSGIKTYVQLYKRYKSRKREENRMHDVIWQTIRILYSIKITDVE